MIVAVIAYATARLPAPHGRYDGWLAARGEHLGRGVDASIMDRTHVREAIDRGRLDALVAANDLAEPTEPLSLEDMLRYRWWSRWLRGVGEGRG
jgi:hypothetical protein